MIAIHRQGVKAMADSKGKKREMLIEAARDALVKYGFKKVTLEDIAEKVEMAKTSIYYYFDSKTEIIKAVARRELNRLMNRMRDAVEAAPTPEKKLIELVKARYLFLQEVKSVVGLNIEELIHEVGPMVRAERDRFLGAEMELFRQVVQEGVSKGHFSVDDSELFALIAISGMRGLDKTFLMYGQHERITEGIEGMMKLFIYGLKKR